MNKVKVRVPATSANIGPGFDVLGIALSLYNTFTFEKKESGLSFTGCERKYANEKNLLYVSFKLVADAAGKEVCGLSIDTYSEIPVARGLGSSASLIAAGAFAANVLLDCGYTKEELVRITTPLEGHPDNLAPAMLGGFTAAMTDDGELFTVNLDICEELRFFALVPNFETKTSHARAVLPTSIVRADSVFNTSHALLLTKAFKTGDMVLLSHAIKDKLHEQYRKKLIFGFDDAKNAAKRAGAEVFFISGSGSTCMCVSKNDITEALKEALAPLPNSWRVYPLSVDKDGAKAV